MRLAGAAVALSLLGRTRARAQETLPAQRGSIGLFESGQVTRLRGLVVPISVRSDSAFANHEWIQHCQAPNEVAQTSKSAVSRVSKPANHASSHPADLEIGDTAGLETCATPRRCLATEFVQVAMNARNRVGGYEVDRASTHPLNAQSPSRPRARFYSPSRAPKSGR